MLDDFVFNATSQLPPTEVKADESSLMEIIRRLLVCTYESVLPPSMSAVVIATIYLTISQLEMRK